MRSLLATLLGITASLALPASAQTPKQVTTPPLSMIGQGTPPAAAATAPFALKRVAMPPLSMTGQGSGPPSAPSHPFQAKHVAMPALGMTGLGTAAPPASTTPPRPAPTRR